MSSIKSIVLNGQSYSIGDSDSDNGITITNVATKNQKLVVNVVWPSQVLNDQSTNITTPVLNITLTPNPGFKPGTIVIDGVDTDKTDYSITANKSMKIAASEATLLDKDPLIIELKNSNNVEDVIQVNISSSDIKGTVYWSYSSDLTTGKILDATSSDCILSTTDNSKSKIYVWSDDVATSNDNLCDILAIKLQTSLFVFKSESECDDATTMYLSGSLMGMINPSYSNKNNTLCGCLASLFNGVKICTIDAHQLNISDYIDYCVESKITYCVAYLFNKSSVQCGPIVKSLKLPQYCCMYMYQRSSLCTAPDILATEINEGGCYNMFSYCRQLTTDNTHPYIAISDINKLGYYGFGYMFYGCSSIDELQLNFTNVTNIANNNCNSWLYSVKSTGTFYTVSTCDWPSGNSGIPTGWTRINTDE